MHKSILIFLLLALFSAPVVFAAVPTTAQGIIDVFNNILKWFASAFWIAAAGFMFYAGYLYMFAYGDTEKISKAKSALLYTIIAIIVGVMTSGAPKLIKSILSVGGSVPATDTDSTDSTDNSPLDLKDMFEGIKPGTESGM